MEFCIFCIMEARCNLNGAVEGKGLLPPLKESLADWLGSFCVIPYSDVAAFPGEGFLKHENH